MKRILLSALICIFLVVNHSAQVDRAAAGLKFSTALDFNGGETGNPGFLLKTWITLDNQSRLHIIPSVVAFNRYKTSNNILSLTNWMLHGDVDVQYAFWKEGTVTVVAFAGGNMAYLISDVEPTNPDIPLDPTAPSDQTEFVPGANLGAGLELRMAPKWDFNLTGKYVFSKYGQFVISVEAAYWFKNRRRSYGR